MIEKIKDSPGNIFKYIKTYGNLTFEEKKVTDIDVLIFSQLTYIDFKKAFESNKEGIKLSTLWQKVSEHNKEITSLAQRNSIKIIKTLHNKKRYKDLILKNYVYYLAEDTQFGALTIEVPNERIYVAFEGTDSTVWGWKEDFQLTYIYPTNSQKMATKYLNDTIKLLGKDVVVCGHSKGGNLALVGAMNTKMFKKSKIKRIYSFDGPGLKDEEFNSLNYKLIKDKLINIIPNSSLVGILLNQEKEIVVKSFGLGLFQHLPTTWLIEDDKFKLTTQNKLSKKLDKLINKWLAKHNYQERKDIIETVFGVFEEANIKKFSDIKLKKLESIYKIIKSTNEIDEETKEIIRNSIGLLATDLKTEMTKEYKENIKNIIENINDFEIIKK